jgi:hypothetical protein
VERVVGDEAGSEAAGLVAQRGTHEGRFAVEREPGAQRGAERIQQRVTGFGEAATHHHGLRVEQCQAGEQAVGEGIDRIPPDGRGDRITLGGERRDAVGSDGPRGVPGSLRVLAGDRRGGGQHLQAAA